MNDKVKNKVDVFEAVMENVDDIDERILIEFFKTLFKRNPFAGMSKVISHTDKFNELVSQGLGGFQVVITSYDINKHPFYDMDYQDDTRCYDCWHIELTRTNQFKALVTVDVTDH